MNNADMPAMPIGEQIDTHQLNAPCNGLTKREHFAGLAMQGILAKYGPDEQRNDTTAIDAIEHADALLAELDKVKS
jgi:hypothetical protein